ncbi:MAG TPA: POTRA domain-containing protein [Pyrinomonadaceae bacterium]|nr:POTRA domain-containing protein [Pyrinomonadaceae bacterium]
MENLRIGSVHSSLSIVYCLFSVFRFPFSVSCVLLLVAYCSLLAVHAQNKYEDRQISNVDIVFEGKDRDVSAAQQFELIARNALGTKYSTVKVRDAIQALYNTEKIVSASVERTEVGQNGLDLRFIIKRKVRAEKVNILIGDTVGKSVTEQQLLLKLNLLNPGTAITDQTLRNNADLILDYLRERGYFKAEVTYTQRPLQSETQVTVTFLVTLNAQATVENFNINIAGFDRTKFPKKLKLQPGEPFSRELLTQDLEKIRAALREEKFLAPELEEPRVVYDGGKNAVNIELNGKVGAVVNVIIDAGKTKELSDKTQTKLLTVRREGTLDFAAIIEGSRRLRNYYQEQGYFFADVRAVCSVTPEFKEEEASVTTNETDVLCSALSGAELSDRVVDVKYQADLRRRLRLVDIRLEGTDQFAIDEVKSVLKSQEKSILGIIPFFGYGRGYTSTETLEQDRLTIKSLLRELGYRNNEVAVRQGVSPNGEDLIITFTVTEGIPTRIAGVEIAGNKALSTATLEAKLPSLAGKNFSRARARNGVKELSQFYSQEGYYDAKVSYSLIELTEDKNAAEEQVKVVYNIENEGKKVFINRILINGNDATKREAILKAINLRVDDVLRSTDIFTSEQNLYGTDAFNLVEIKPEPAGEKPDGSGRLTDIIINVEEQKPRLIIYGGGFSTDIGANGFFNIRHFNLFGKLQQGGAQVRVSRLQQLVQVDFINPRFMPDGKNRFAPLTVSASYQQDSTVTRFFRTTFDKGTSGIVQRIDENGNPIDEFGRKTGSPTINRLTVSAETSRTISTKNRSILFFRYRFQDVRLFKISSLLIRDLLLPDARVRTSGFGANFVFDTRENCNIKYTILDIIAKGDAGEPCRYNPGDPTRGTYITAEYNVSVPTLGANIGFQKFQGSYNTYYTFPRLKNTTLAGRAVLGLGSVFSRNQGFSSSQFPDLEGLLPISERFFAGGSTTLRGFEFETAGPRVAIAPQGTFRNQKGEIVTINPFTVPFGGNALAIVNLEARVPLTDSVRVVPFYDGGNVFRRVGDIFKPPAVDPNDVFRSNLRAVWTHTVGLGLRLKAPVGGEFGVDYGYLLNPPQFLIPQVNAPNTVFRLKQGQLHFRFSQAF